MSGRKTFVGGDILLASEVNGFLMDQAVMVFNNASARTSAIPSPDEGMVTYLKDTNLLQVYNGSAWVLVGDITKTSGVSLSSPTAGQKLVFDGTNWVNLTGYVFVQTLYFTSSGTFTKATYPWLRAIRVKCQGGGGGGGGAVDLNTSAGGGAGGGYGEKFITNISGLASSVTVTRGAGGSGSAAGGNGNPGENSSFGSLIVADGGGGGVRDGGSFSVGGLVTGADFSYRGAFGGRGGAHVAGGVNGGGGDSVLGFGGPGAPRGSDGSQALGFGSGGAGASRDSGDVRFGSDGAPGIVIVELYA